MNRTLKIPKVYGNHIVDFVNKGKIGIEFLDNYTLIDPLVRGLGTTRTMYDLYTR